MFFLDSLVRFNVLRPHLHTVHDFLTIVPQNLKKRSSHISPTSLLEINFELLVCALRVGRHTSLFRNQFPIHFLGYHSDGDIAI